MKISKELVYAFFLTHSIKHATDKRPLSILEFEKLVFVDKDEELRKAILNEKENLKTLAKETKAMFKSLPDSDYA